MQAHTRGEGRERRLRLSDAVGQFGDRALDFRLGGWLASEGSFCWQSVTIAASNRACVLPSYGSQIVPEPLRPSVRMVIQTLNGAGSSKRAPRRDMSVYFSLARFQRKTNVPRAMANRIDVEGSGMGVIQN